MMASCDTENTKMMKKNSPIFCKGEPVAANFSGAAWLNYLSRETTFNCAIYNVTFAPGVRNDWHVHSVGQILLCTDGNGYYQEKGKPALKLSVGDVVEIPAATQHWHGAAPDSQFTHIGITPKVSENQAEWIAPVTDEEYREATK